VLTDDLRAFIRATIPSVWTLELLLFLRGHESRVWSVQELTRELRATTLIVERGLAAFAKAGLVVDESGGTVRYAPAAERLRVIVDQIAAAYATQPFAVSNEIYAPEAKIQDFADAFKLRKD